MKRLEYTLAEYHLPEWCHYVLLSLAVCCTAGNWDTLEVRPKARGVDTRQELLRFYGENYSANIMHLVVYAKGK